MSDRSYPHLLPAARELAEAPDKVRIARLRADRWLSYARADAALAALEDLLSFPKRTRMPNLLLVGPTNNGKTMILQKFCRDSAHAATGPSNQGVAKVPVLKVQMPPAPDERRFFAAIMGALGAPDRASEHISMKQEIALRLMRASAVDMLILDEIHNVLCGTREQQRRVLNLLRWLGNELQIPLVAVGTAEALRAVHSDDQLANRFMPFALPPWRQGPEYSRLVSTLEAVMPLKEPSGLSEPKTAQRLLNASEGILGEIVTIVVRAAAAAIAAGEERITPERLDAIGFVAPSARRRVAIS